MPASSTTRNTSRIALLTCCVTSLLLAGIALFFGMQGPKIAYVRSNDLISKYHGTIESRKVADISYTQWKANLDTMHQDFRQAVNRYNESFTALSVSERKDRESYLAGQEEQIATYAQQVQQMAEQEEEKLMEGTLNQINTFISRYGKEQGYDIILGTTAAGSLLYAEEGYDITEEVLAALNADYRSTDARTDAKK